MREAYGKFTGFIYGWAEFSINRAATIAAVAYIFSTYLRSIIPFDAGSEKWVALLAIFIFTLINIAGLHFGVTVQNFLSSFKVIAILAIAGLIFYFAKPEIQTTPGLQLSNIDFRHVSGFAPALVAILWSYGGWHESTFMSGEFKDTKRELPFALIVSALIVMGLYVFINAAYLYLMAPSEMAQSNAIASDALTRLFGSNGKLIVTMAILISTLGALNSNILTGARVPFSMAQDFPRLAWLGGVNHRLQTPLRSFVINAVWASALVLWGNFEQILFLNAFEIWFFFILAGISIFILRRKTFPPSSFSMMGYPVVPILFTLVSICLCLTTIQSAPREALFGALIMAAGVPIYFLTKASSRR